MTRYRTGAALVTACKSGQGTIVLLEGDDEHDDPYYYTRWFGDKALEISFFPQNGWAKVVDGVQDLRAQLPGRKIFGIIDRDFSDPSILAAQDQSLPADGVLRTRRYTLENYLLDPSGWFSVVQLLHRSPPAGWTSLADVEQRINDAYRRCIPLAAWNYTVYLEHLRLPQGGREYREHPDSVPGTAAAELLAWGQTRNAPVPLDQVFDENKARIAAMQPSDWPEVITGKAVLKALRHSLPSAKPIPLDVCLNRYLDQCPAPPAELHALILRLL